MKKAELFAAPPAPVRRRVKLDHHLYPGLETLPDHDRQCAHLADEGRLTICGSHALRQAMREVKNPNLAMHEFQELADRILAQLAKAAAHATSEGPRKAAIAMRAANAFSPFVRRFMPGTPVGFLGLSRDHDTLKAAVAGSDKLGSFHGVHAVLFDPMLATGGSMVEMIDSVLDRGATGITTVSAFSSPQGVLQVAAYDEVKRIITAPLEAGLTDRGYIVGGHTPYAMLGDFGDRYYGPVE